MINPTIKHDKVLRCPDCGWVGTADKADVDEDGYLVCPNCVEWLAED